MESATYDIVFAGGGATACITAGRLASADPSLKILILEAGPQTKDIPVHVQPARYFRNLAQLGKTLSFHVAKPSEALGGRSVVVPTGRCLGGGSSVNFAMYTRAAPSDYDDWESKYENPGWGSKDLIPLLKKAETYQPGSENSTHGTSGPIKVSYAEEEANVGIHFLDVAGAYDKEREFTDDVNDFSSCDRYGRWPRYIDTVSGRRSDTPHHYIYDQDRPNLTIQDRCRVTRVLIKDNRAVGVEYVDDQADRTQGVLETHTVHASRLVVVSGGCFGSPAILERSGIGAASILKENGIKQIVDLPGVGEHYMDHNVLFTPYIASEDADTLDTIFWGEEAELKPYVDKWAQGGKGLMAHNGLDAGIKMRPHAKDLKEMGAPFEKQWQEYFANALDKPVMWIGTLSAYVGSIPETPRVKYYSLAYYTEYPVSLGHLHVTSGTNAYAPLDFDPGFLTEPADVSVLRWAYKKGREIARRMASYRGEYGAGHPRFPAGSVAIAKVADGPVAISAPDIVYSAEDDEAIDEYHRENVGTTWHSIGTCAMKPRDRGGVVDSRLNVYGVQNLKVADVSIAPANVGSNTYNTAIAVGERAAVIIAEELGIQGV